LDALLTASLAAAPVATVFGLIASRRVVAWKAALIGAGLAFLLAITAWRLPWPAALAAAGYGVATGLFPIVYIIWASLVLYNLTVVTGWAERLRQSLAHLAADRDLLLLVIGFGFAAFLDSTAGFLTPVTVGTALLVGLGVPALDAAAYTLVASSLPPIFGAMGIPVLVMADVTASPLEELARKQAAVAALLFGAFPLWLTGTFGGLSALRRLFVPALAAGAAYGLVLWWMVTRVSLFPAALAASLAALAAVALTRRRGPAPSPRPGEARRPSWLPWWPYAILMVCVTGWSLPAVARALGRSTLTLAFPALPGIAWRLDVLASPGTAIVVTVLLVALLGRSSGPRLREAIHLSNRQLRYPLVSMLAMFALAQMMNVSGMTRALGLVIAGAGGAFPLLSPFLSWFGGAVAGSNTASNALLGRLQAVTASQLGLEPLHTLALAGAAAPLGKMVAPQVIAAAVAAGRLEGAEGRLLRTGLLHSVAWTSLIGAAGWLLSLR
jgi:lactate permease